MTKTILLIFLSTIFLSCTKEHKNINKLNTKETTELTFKENPKYHDNNDPKSALKVSPDLKSIFPKDETELAEWKRKVREEGDTLYFNKLIMCNTYNYGLRSEGYMGYDISGDQIRILSDIMLTKYAHNLKMSTKYKYLYVTYSSHSKSITKDEIEKAIKYANDILAITDNDLIEMQAREFIATHTERVNMFQKTQ